MTVKLRLYGNVHTGRTQIVSFGGNMSKEEEKQTKLKEKVNIWWYNLDLSYRFELIEPYYPDKAFLMDVDEMWHGLDWKDKLDIYKENVV